MGKAPIRQSPNFHEGMKILSSDIQQKVLETVELYRENPYHPNLHNHFLRERSSAIRSILVEGDVRIILRDVGDFSIILMDV
jgi:mRNA-degrading endonuclease YafQ of YafQ-DinJ toxin-antitoxin module